MSLPDDERALMERPVQPYVGLTLEEAEELAAAEGRCVRVLESLAGGRHLDLMPSRVNVELDEAGQVIDADAGYLPFTSGASTSPGATARCWIAPDSPGGSVSSTARTFTNQQRTRSAYCSRNACSAGSE